MCYILSRCSEIASKTTYLKNDKPDFSCSYVSCTPIEDFTIRNILIQMNLVFIESWNPVAIFTFDHKTTSIKFKKLSCLLKVKHSEMLPAFDEGGGGD